ncbi:MAG UNVERIFIED_CONTAM: hypothetical protein LVT10_12820 [Anaerolineae bacterium]
MKCANSSRNGDSSDQLTLSNLYERRLVTDMDEVEYLYGLGIVGLHTPILLGNYYDENPPQDQPEPTTIGRAIFNRHPTR